MTTSGLCTKGHTHQKHFLGEGDFPSQLNGETAISLQSMLAVTQLMLMHAFFLESPVLFKWRVIREWQEYPLTERASVHSCCS